MNRSEIDGVKSEMLKAANDVPADQSFAALSLRAEDSLNKSIAEARVIVDAAARASGGSAKLTNPGGEDVPALSDATFLIEGLRRAKDMIFRDVDRVDIGIGGGRVNKVSRRLYDATEGYFAARSAAAAIEASLEDTFGGFRKETYEMAAKAIITVCEWDQGGSEELERQPYALNSLRSIERSGAVSLTLFVCPPVEFGYIRSDQPEQYLRTTLNGSLLSKQVADLRRLFLNLERSSVPTRLQVIVGDADENDYIWPVLGRPQALTEDLLAPRRQQLCDSITRYLSVPIENGSMKGARVIDAEQLRVSSLAATQFPPQALAIYEQFVARPELMQKFLRPQDSAEECRRMLELWGAGDYYDGLPQPDAAGLEQIVVRKFAAYAMQGVFLNASEPNTILVQTERPALLRTRMLNIGRVFLNMPKIPAIYQRLSREDLVEQSCVELASDALG